MSDELQPQSGAMVPVAADLGANNSVVVSPVSTTVLTAQAPASLGGNPLPVPTPSPLPVIAAVVPLVSFPVPSPSIVSSKTSAVPQFTAENPPKDSSGKPDYPKLSPAEKKKILEAEKIFQQGLSTIRDLIAPSSMEVAFNHLLIDGMFAQSFFVYTYPRYIETNWLSPIVNFDVTMDMAQFIYPIPSDEIMKVLKSQVAKFNSSIRMAQEKGQVRDPGLETALEDAESLRTDLQRGQEKFFQFALYFTVYHEDQKKLERLTKQLESLLGGKLVLTRRADLRMEHAFNSTLPLGMDQLEIYHNMNTSPLATTFPFVSSELTSNEGVLYGLNRHNRSEEHTSELQSQSN